MAPVGAKYSTAGVRAGFLIPERGNVERIQQSFKDVTKRIDAMTQAANKLLAGEIDYLTYDKLVNDVKPIIPYETVPAPATIEEMRNGLKSDQIKKINRLSSIPEGTQVLLRLDIQLTGTMVFGFQQYTEQKKQLPLDLGHKKSFLMKVYP